MDPISILFWLGFSLVGGGLLKSGYENYTESEERSVPGKIYPPKEYWLERGFVLGIDPAKSQGKVDWDKVKADNIRFAVVKATQSGIANRDDKGNFINLKSVNSFPDPQFQRNQKEARRTMERVGYYHYMHPEAKLNPKQQAQYFAKTVGPLRKNEFLVLDFERRDLARSVVVKAWNDFLTELEALTGRKPWVYTSASLANQYKLGDTFGNYPLWVVYYVSKVSPKIPNGWDSWKLWQVHAKGKVNGIKGFVDIDVAHKSFLEGDD